MHMLFMDESGTPPKADQDAPKYFVVGGIIIPMAIWQSLRDAVQGQKIRLRLRGEMKWRYFSPTNRDLRNPMRELSNEDRNAIREELYQFICAHRSVKTLACVVSCVAAYRMASVNEPQDIYHLAYKGVTERFQYHLQDMSREIGTKQLGIVVSDHRGRDDDKVLRGVHQKLLHSKGGFISSYDNFVEGLFLTPSHHSIGIQLADLVAGAVWRRFERDDGRAFEALKPSLRTGRDGTVEGYGIIKSPKAGWE
jgi:hypothetical protein